jgi:hypothetical protein
MAIVFDEVVATVEPEVTRRQDQEPPSPPKIAALESVRAELSILAQRAARLRAD